MTKKITLLFVIFLSILKLNAQITLSESFTGTFVPSSSGWIVQNNSVPTGTATWFQGNGATFPAFVGSPNDYYAVNYLSQGSTSGGISNFLITPTVNLVNGATISFATRSIGPTYPDRLQVLMSQGTGTGAIGAGTVSVGTFTTTLLDINPGLTNFTNSAVNSGTVNGYPNVWTVYTMTLSAITGTVPGRFAFRYFVNDGGVNGANSDYIGIDEVQYSVPCAQPTINVTPNTISLCSGSSATVVGTGALTYTWSNGAMTSSVAVSPSVTTTYTLSGSNAGGCIGTNTVAVTVTTTPVLSVPSLTICPASSGTIVATGATTYSWSTGATSSSIVVTPSVSTVYTVTGNNGVCVNTKTVSITLGSNLSVLVSASSPSVCAGSSATLSAMGASSYTWLPTGSGSSIVVTPTANTTYSVVGNSGACFGANTVAITIGVTPTVTISSSVPGVLCSGAQAIITATGAATYVWVFNATQTGTFNPITLTAGPTATLGVFTFTGTAANGCSNTATFTQTISTCTGIENVNQNKIETAVYPNPFSNELIIKDLVGSIELINSLGQFVMRSKVNEFETINTRDLLPGIYFMKTFNSEGKPDKVIKLIKN